MSTITTLLASQLFIVPAIIGIIIAMAILIENELEGWATTLFSLGIALLLWNFRTDIWGFISSNPKETIGFSIFYVIIGILWSFIKWRTYLKNFFSRLKKAKDDFISVNGSINEENLRSFNKEINELDLRNAYGRLVSFHSSTFEEMLNQLTPEASNKKTLITSWVSFWPVSFLATMLNNPFRRFFEWIYESLSGYYDKMTNNYKKDLLK